MKILELFPLTVFCQPIGFPSPEGHPEDQKNSWVQHILKMREASDPPRSEISAWTGDVKGHEFIHKEPTFEPLFESIATGVETYLQQMGLDFTQLNLYFTRSWAVVAYKNERVNRHAHLQSHLSVAYYVQKPKEGGRLAFFNSGPPNEFVPGLFESRMGSLFTGPRSPANSANTIVDVEEGDMVIFPSKTVHATEPHQSETPRISISADIVITLKESKNHEFLLPDFSHWKKMNA